MINVTALVYARDDIVSDSLRGASRAWEAEGIQQMLRALHSPVPPSPALLSGASANSWRRPESPLLVDVGANVGWFSLNAASAGARVAAFEAMGANARLLRASLCANGPRLMDRVALFAAGLGSSRADCSVISDAKNRGDGHTVCNSRTGGDGAIIGSAAATGGGGGPGDAEAVAREWTLKTGRKYEARGAVSLFRLDALVDEDVQVMKLDVEGHELEALKGADRLLRERRVWHLMAECDASLPSVGEAGKDALLRLLDERGYYVSTFSFRGPYLSSRKIRRGEVGKLPSTTVYAVLRALRDAESEATALRARATLRPAAGTLGAGTLGAGRSGPGGLGPGLGRRS